MIVRPPRSEYEDSQVPESLTGGEDGNGPKAPRTAFIVKSPEGYDIPGSFYEAENAAPGKPTIIFSHGNAMDQTATFGFLPAETYVALGISICAFDFAGCGRGTSPIITMGFREKGEIGAVIDHLKAKFGVSRIILWGLSMGAFSTFLALAQRTDVTVAVCDSTYDSIAGFMKFHYPRSAAAYAEARQKIQEQANFDVETVDAVAVAPQVTTPVIFLHGVNDKVVDQSMSKRVFDAVPGKKQYVTFRGHHTSFRPTSAYDEVEKFIRAELGL
jgi:pimeloyl-ACP methyl ester carboxylesterase